MGKKAKPEEIIAKLREVEVRLARGETAASAARAVGVTEQTYYRWRKEYGGLQVDQAKRMKEIEGQTPEELSGEEALEIALHAAPRLKAAATRGELQEFEPGEHVAVAPDDYGRDWVEGEIVIAAPDRIVIHRHDDKAETLNLHFPRTGFMVRRLG